MTPSLTTQHRSRSIHIDFAAITFALYLIRDSFGGVLRYASSVLHADVIWFVPDAAGVICIFVFIQRCMVRNQSALAFFVLVQIIISLVIGYAFLGTFKAALSSFKMIVPVFAGFCFCNDNFGSYDRLLLLIRWTLYISVAGVLLSPYVNFPWVGFEYESFGASRTAGRLWWAGQEQRLSGFSTDNTMAGYFILISFVLTSVRSSTIWCIACGVVSLYAIRLTTSKTTMIVLGIYLLCLLIVRALPERSRFPAVRKIALWSFLAPTVPLILIILFSGGNQQHSGSFLFSMQDRIDNSWQLPFVYLGQLMPIGMLTGCGLGCFNYPQHLFSPLASYFVPVDNFYIGTYLMFGLPFVGFMWLVFRSTMTVTDIYKLCVIFVQNMFTITTLSYGPAASLMVIAFGFSEVFSRASTTSRFGAPTAEHPARMPNALPRAAAD